MSSLKYTKNIDFFIVNILPYVELFLNEYPHEILMLYAAETICDIINVMFCGHIVTQKMTRNFHLLDSELIELDVFLSKYYDMTKTLTLTKPLNPQNHSYLKSKKFICVFPKFKPTEAYNNISQNMMDTLMNKIKFTGYEIFIVGHQFERLNTKHGKDINNFIDTLDYLRHCKVFITSESYWHYIALLCNCRNIVVFNSNSVSYPNSLITYNPFHNNIHMTNKLTDDDTCEIIQKMLL